MSREISDIVVNNVIHNLLNDLLLLLEDYVYNNKTELQLIINQIEVNYISNFHENLILRALCIKIISIKMCRENPKSAVEEVSLKLRLLLASL